jgi:hypothetical protein
MQPITPCCQPARIASAIAITHLSRSLHPQIPHQKRPLVSEFSDELGGGFVGAVAGADFDADEDGGGAGLAFLPLAVNLKLPTGTTRSSVSAVVMSVAGYFVPFFRY